VHKKTTFEAECETSPLTNRSNTESLSALHSTEAEKNSWRSWEANIQCGLFSYPGRI